MRTHILTLFSLLLLATQVLLADSKKEVKNRHVSKATTLGKPQAEQRSQPPKYLTKGKFVTQDQADCTWVVTKQEKGVVLKLDCTRRDEKFSCFFTGDPTSCLELNEKSYWKQIGWSLRSQKVLCGDSKSVLKTRVCRKNFPESNLRLVNSTMIRKKSNQESMEPLPSDQSTVNETSLMEPDKVKENTLSGSAESKTLGSNDPECLEDVDLKLEKTAVEHCGETWSFFCKLFFTVVQGNSC